MLLKVIPPLPYSRKAFSETYRWHSSTRKLNEGYDTLQYTDMIRRRLVNFNELSSSELTTLWGRPDENAEGATCAEKSSPNQPRQ